MNLKYDDQITSLQFYDGKKYVRRYSMDNWEQLLGESWEPLYCCKEYEKEYENLVSIGKCSDMEATNDRAKII